MTSGLSPIVQVNGTDTGLKHVVSSHAWLLQTCNFNFMNRLTDGLHLPSEDEAIKIYREIYGRDGLRPLTRH